MTIGSGELGQQAMYSELDGCSASGELLGLGSKLRAGAASKAKSGRLTLALSDLSLLAAGAPLER
jgi:hypothetical protein